VEFRKNKVIGAEPATVDQPPRPVGRRRLEVDAIQLDRAICPLHSYDHTTLGQARCHGLGPSAAVDRPGEQSRGPRQFEQVRDLGVASSRSQPNGYQTSLLRRQIGHVHQRSTSQQHGNQIAGAQANVDESTGKTSRELVVLAPRQRGVRGNERERVGTHGAVAHDQVGDRNVIPGPGRPMLCYGLEVEGGHGPP
jgi:hypothetical protein